MPGYDGTGPAGLGPFTGGGRGYCAVTLPDERKPGALPFGFVGRQGTPVALAALLALAGLWRCRRFARPWGARRLWGPGRRWGRRGW